MKTNLNSKGRQYRAFALLLFALIFVKNGFSQPGNQCSSALLMEYGSSCYMDSLQDKDQDWYQFVADDSATVIFTTGPTGNSLYVTSITAYNGSCSSLQQIGSASAVNPTPVDSLVLNLSGLNIGDTVWVEVNRNDPASCGNCNFPDQAVYQLCKQNVHSILGLYNSFYPPVVFQGCGVNFALEGARMNRRYSTGAGISPPQPTTITISTIPQGAQILAAYLYFVMVGDTTAMTAPPFSLTNPNSVVTNSSAALIARYNGDATCWDYPSSANYPAFTSSYKANITSVISGNGNYVLSGIPIQTGLPTSTRKDIDGASVFIVYQELCGPASAIEGKVILRDGLSLIMGGSSNTFNYPVNAFPSNTNGRFFFSVGDVESSTTTINTKVNGLQCAATFWTAGSTGQNYTPNMTNFTTTHVSSAADCSALIMYGSYFQNGGSSSCQALSVSAGTVDSVICTGQLTQVTSTVSGGTPGYTYNWSPAGGLSCATCTAPIANPSQTTTYTLTVTDANGCTASSSVTVHVYQTPSSSFSGTISACDSAAVYCPDTIAPGVSYTWTVWDAGFTTQYSYTSIPLAGCILMDWVNTTNASGGYVVLTATNAQGCTSSDTLEVKPCCRDSATGNFFYNPVVNNNILRQGDTLYINGTATFNANAHFKQCIINMAPGAKIIVQGGHTLRIEETAVRGGCCEMWDAIEGMNLNDSIIIYKNSYIGDGIRGVVSNNGSVFRVYDHTTFNRNLVSITVNPYAGNHGGTVQQSDFISVATNYCTPSQNTLLPPYSGQKPAYGIKVNGQVTDITVGNGTAPALVNTFDGLHNGIRANKTNIRVVNCSFKNINLTAAGKAVWTAAAIGLTGFKTLRVGTGGNGNYQRCVFENCRTGISADTNMSVTVFRNKFNNTTGVISGYTAILVQNARHQQNLVSIQLDTIYNHNRGIHCVQNSKATHQLVQNYIEITQPVNAPQGTGLLVLDLAGNAATYNIYNNRVNKVRFGISASGLINANIQLNAVRISPSNVTLLATTGISLTASTNCDITQNVINSTALNLNTQNGGILVSGNVGGRVICNKVDSLGYGIQFSGANNAPQTVRRNNLTDLTHGIWLSNNAVINPQGSATVPQDNQWFGAIPNRCYTSGPANNFTNGQFSPFFYRPGASFSPLPSNADLTNNNIAIQIFAITTSLPVPPNCVIFPQAVQPEEQLMEDIAQGTINADNPDPLWISRDAMYRSFREDSTLYLNNQVLTGFKDSVDMEATGKLYDSYKDLSNASLMPLASLSNAAQTADLIAPSNNGEDNMKAVVAIALNSFEQGRGYDANEVAQLQLIASLCPFTDGDAVYFARTLLSPFDTTGYVNTCETGTEQNHRPVAFGQPGVAAPIPVTLYPNPNSGAVTVTYTIGEQDRAELFFYDVTGSLVKTVRLLNGSRQQELNLSGLQPGVYMYMVKVNGETGKTDRMVIIK